MLCRVAYHLLLLPLYLISFFFTATATTEIYTLSLHDALPICSANVVATAMIAISWPEGMLPRPPSQPDLFPILTLDQKRTRLNSSHQIISYAVFCLKKKKHANYGTFL